MGEVPIKLSGLWVALMLTYLLGDVLRIYSGDFKAGEIGGRPMTQAMWLGIAILMMIPIVMVFLSLTLNQPVNRWVNIIVAVFFFIFNLIGLPTYPSACSPFRPGSRLSPLLETCLNRFCVTEADLNPLQKESCTIKNRKMRPC
ncbi:MAG TPA: DUF6326 family protein [Promineifilum sp.]|nr:DUF6326 family protein [Promineifilum sp.]